MIRTWTPCPVLRRATLLDRRKKQNLLVAARTSIPYNSYYENAKDCCNKML